MNQFCIVCCICDFLTFVMVSVVQAMEMLSSAMVITRTVMALPRALVILIFGNTKLEKSMSV